jgi:two-component system, OmpR family, sensor histidine kinase BaeS
MSYWLKPDYRFSHISCTFFRDNTNVRISITTKVFATLLTATSVVVAGMYLFMQRSFEQGFIHFVEARQQQRIEFLSQRLAEEYQEGLGWDRLRGNRQGWFQLLRERPFADPLPQSASPGGPEHRLPLPRQTSWRDVGRAPSVHPRLSRLALLDVDKSVVVGEAGETSRLELHPVIVNAATVGYLGVLPGPPAKELAELRFERQHAHSLALIAAMMLLLSAALGFPLAYTLVRPLRRIAEASRQLALGHYTTRLPVSSSDEIGWLARDINDLARALQETEHSRRQWVADISHELRTPLSVLRGEVEALQDGMRPWSEEALGSLHGEIMQLSRLVDELYQLSLSDVGALTYHKTKIDPLLPLEDTLAALANEFRNKDLRVTLKNDLPRPVCIHADADRLTQLFRNLLTNSLKYTQPGGRVELTAGVAGDRLRLDFQDTDPGVPEAALAHLFDRFYRVDSSRSRATGGAGLGLAICRNIVEAHDGRIVARHSPLGGLWLRVELPALS